MAEEKIKTAPREAGEEDRPRHGTHETEENTGNSRLLRDARERARERGREVLAERQSRTVRMLEDLAGALHSSARELKKQSHPTSSHYFDRAAEGLQRLSGALHERDPEVLSAEIRGFARRQPALLLAGAVAAGFLLARVLKSGGDYRQLTQSGEPVVRSETRTGTARTLH